MFQAKSVISVGLLSVLSLSAGACSKSAQQYFDAGNKYLEQEKPREAIVEYRNAIQKDPKFGDARYKLAETLARAGDAPGALREYVRAADLLPANKDAQLKAGTFLMLAGQFADAKTRAQKVLAMDARNVQAQVLLANATAGLKDLPGAIVEIRKAIDFAPKDSRTYMNLGAMYMANANAVDAETAFKQAVDIDPKSVPALLALAQFYGSSGRAADAEQALMLASELDPKNVEANRALASFYLATNRAKEAEGYLRSIADTTKEGGAQLELADYFVYMQRNADAIAILDSLANQKATFSPARMRIAAIQYQDRRPLDAHKTIDEVLTQEPANIGALLLKGEFLLAERKPDEALARATTAATADPRNPAAHYLLGAIYASKNDSEAAIKAFNEVVTLDSRSVSAHLQLARLQLEQGAAAVAVTHAEQAVNGQPNNPATHMMLARSLLVSGNIARAETEARLLVEKMPGAAQSHAILGSVLIAKKDLVAARQSYDRALQIDPKSLDALPGLIALDFNARKPADAVARIDAALAGTPGNASLLELAARTYGAAGDAAKAEQALLRSIEVEPSSIQAYGMLGQLYVSQRRLDEGRAKFEEILRRQPKSVGAMTMVGVIFGTQGKDAEARKAFEKVLEIDPRAPVAANNLAWALATANETLNVALDLAKTAKAGLPDSADVDDTLGWVYYRKGLWSLAVSSFRQAIEKTPANPSYHFRLGMALLRNSDAAGARRSLEQALKLSATFPEAAEAKTALAAIR